jgi:RHS repeat-associated protein
VRVNFSGNFQVRADKNGTQFWNGAENLSPEDDTCNLSTCTEAAITVSQPVVITVVDPQGVTQTGLSVYAFIGSTYANKAAVTDTNGQAELTLPLGAYRFRVDKNGTEFWSGAESNCDQQSCHAVTVAVTNPVSVSVLGVDDSAFAGIPVYAFIGTTYANKMGVSDINGQVQLTLLPGEYRFRADINGVQFWTDSIVNVPQSSTARITLPGAEPDVQVNTIDYKYDPLYRLTAADYDSGIYFHYQHDAVGNRLEEAKKVDPGMPEVVTTYTYDIANRLTSAGGMSYTWDDNGNLLNDGVSTYTYDYNNKLVGLTQGTNTYSYAYTGMGDRIQQIVNSVTADYVLDINSGLTQVLQDGTNTYLYGINRVAQGTTTQTEYFLGDALGSVRNLVDSAGMVTLTQSYTPYGEVLDTAGTGVTEYAYTGEMYDAETGLVFLRTRYYSVGDGRFLGMDQWDGDERMPMSYNAWLYVYANPVNLTDPKGLYPICEGEDCERFITDKELNQLFGVYYKGDWTLHELYALKVAIDMVSRRLRDESGTRMKKYSAFRTVYGITNSSNHMSFTWDTNCYNCRPDQCKKPKNKVKEYWTTEYQYDDKGEVLKKDGVTQYIPITIDGENFPCICTPKGGVTLTSKSYEFATMWPYQIDGTQYLRNINNVIHELGHGFNSRLDFIPSTELTSYTANIEGTSWSLLDRTHGFYLYPQFIYVQSRINTGSEIFADMFIGWVNDKWEPDAYGIARKNFMEERMTGWIRNAMKKLKE